MFVYGSIDTPCYPSEPPEVADNEECDNTEYDQFCLVLESTRRKDEMVEKMSRHQDAKIESRKLDEGSLSIYGVLTIKKNVYVRSGEYRSLGP